MAWTHRLLRHGRLAAGVCVAVACGEPVANDSDAPRLTQGLTAAVDKNPDPHVVELDLVAGPATVEYRRGVKTAVWAYNGTVPGPVVDVAVGDKLVVHFRNDLPQATTIHWHGIRLPNAMDGVVRVQNPIPPGGTFEYSFVLRDAGLYWFHPHHRSDEQTYRGLYGVIRVRGTQEPKVDREDLLVLDDTDLKADGSLSDHVSDYQKLSEHQKLHGRTGPDVLVNGQVGRTIDVAAGGVQRLRLVNAANLRYFNLRVPGHALRVIGSDGGLFEKPYDAGALAIGPAERYDVLLLPQGQAGQAIALLSDPYQRSEDDPQAAAAVATLRLAGPALSGKMLPDALPGVAVPRLPVPDGDALLIEFDFGKIGGQEGYNLPPNEHDPVPKQPGDPIFLINKKAGSDIPPLLVPLGGVRKFKVHNVSHQIHVFHLHGFFFQVVDTDDWYDPKTQPFGLRKELAAQGHKDTITVREGYSVTIVARFDEPGLWMYHCHIPEHSEHGMMGEIHVN